MTADLSRLRLILQPPLVGNPGWIAVVKTLLLVLGGVCDLVT